MAFQLKERNKVYLFIKNLYIKRLSKELNNIKVSLFLIKAQKKLVNYLLKLLLNIKVYFTFYIFFIELADLKTLL